MMYIFVILVSYLLGSIPMGILITRVTGYGDLRQIGSGNIGATNVMRAAGLKLAALVWILDMLKTIIAILIGYIIGGIDLAAWCGFFAVLGHCYPVWLRFHGGKGVSCMFGMFLAINPLMFVICGIEWLVVALSLGYSSLAALVVFCVAAILGFTMGPIVGLALLCVALLGLWRHRENIVRLIGGTESKIKWKWKK